MRLSCDRGDLARLLRRVSRAATGAHGGGPLKLTATASTLTAAASDNDLTIESTIAAPATTPGSCVLPGRLLTDAVKSMPPGELTLTANPHRRAVIESVDSAVSQPARFSLTALPEDTFRPPQRLDGPAVAAAGVAAALRKVLSAAATTQTRPLLCSVLLLAGDGWCHTAATDSYRLAAAGASRADPADAAVAALLPHRSSKELLRLCDDTTEVTVAASDTLASFAAGPHRLTTRLIEGSFPAYSSMLHPRAGAAAATVSVKDAAALREVLARVRLVADCNGGHVSMRARSGEMLLSASAPSVGESRETLPVGCDTDTGVIRVNPSYLTDGLDSVTGEARLLVTGSSEPVRIVDSDDFVYLLMPSKPQT